LAMVHLVAARSTALAGAGGKRTIREIEHRQVDRLSKRRLG
jgi:hypothetical protein